MPVLKGIRFECAGLGLTLLFDHSKPQRILLPKEALPTSVSLVNTTPTFAREIITLTCKQMSPTPLSQDQILQIDALLKTSIQSSFQQDVYHTLLSIPAGSTISYAKLAEQSGHPKSARAVGSAMAQNPFPILVPCHRVVLSNGKPGDYRGGTEIKKGLLEYERSVVGEDFIFSLL